MSSPHPSVSIFSPTVLWVPLCHRSHLYEMHFYYWSRPPFWILSSALLRSWSNRNGFRSLLAVWGSWLAFKYGGSFNYSHSKIFEAGEVTCKISRLASENLLEIKREKMTPSYRGLNVRQRGALTNKWITSYWTLGGPKVLKTGEAHLHHKVCWKLIRLEADAVVILANIILSRESGARF